MVIRIGAKISELRRFGLVNDQRAVAQPDIDSDDYLLLSNREWTRLDIFPDVNYLAWSRGQDSVC